MPTPESVIALLGGVAMEKENTTYKYPVYAFKDVEELKRKEIPSFWILFRYASQYPEEGIKNTHFFGHYLQAPYVVF